jgi:hypothetical protein
MFFKTPRYICLQACIHVSVEMLTYSVASVLH